MNETCSPNFAAELLHLLLHALVLADARVLVGDQAGVEVDLLEFLAERG